MIPVDPRLGFLSAAMGCGALVAKPTIAGRVAPRVKTIAAAALALAAARGAAAVSAGPAVGTIVLVTALSVPLVNWPDQVERRASAPPAA